jgi:hypothetical protein
MRPAAYHLAAADAPAGALKIVRILTIVFLIDDCDPRRGAAELNRWAAFRAHLARAMPRVCYTSVHPNRHLAPNCLLNRM